MMAGAIMAGRHLAIGLLIAGLLLVSGLGLSLEAAELTVDSSFPGGSAHIEAIDSQARRIQVVPAAREGRGWVCWWMLKVAGLEPGETLTLDVGGGVWATPDRAAWSADGKTWKQTPAGVRHEQRIVYTLKAEGRELWLAWGPPYVPSDAAQAVGDAAKKSQHAQAFELCRTREDRSTPAIRVTDPGVDDAGKFGVWVQARQHAWESGSSWVCQGFLEWLVSDDARAADLRKKAAVTLVPIMDIDNVTIGAGGKEQKPQDHNRDWSDEPYHKSVAAAQQQIKKLDEAGRFDVFLDLHNPDAAARAPFFYASPKDLLTEPGQQNLAAFLAACREDMNGPLAFVGQVRESGANYDKNWKQISKNWVTQHTRDHVVSVTLETPWNTPESTSEGYRQVGRELGLSLERYLRTAKRRP